MFRLRESAVSFSPHLLYSLQVNVSPQRTKETKMMQKNKVKTYSHLDKEKRDRIEWGLSAGKNFSFIACEVGTTVSTIRREILRNRRCDGASRNKTADKNDCVHLLYCKSKGICDICPTIKLCKRCSQHKCHEICNDYKTRVCPSIEKAPFVCNACERYGRCTTVRYRYSAELAQAQATQRAVESRSGIDLTEDEAKTLTDAVKTGLANGQSIHHIFESRDLPCSERSFYRYVEDQSIPIKSIDLHKKVKYKKRNRPKGKARATGFFAGHEYEDFLLLPAEDRAAVTEVDTVHGKKGDSKCILSLHRVDLHFQIYLLLEKCTTECVIDALDWLEECCDGHFNELFGVFLLDRGSEFDNIDGIERSAFRDGHRCSAYYCDPQQSQQKGACEKNHVELRKVVPKGTSLQAMDSKTLSLICSHVNSTIRKGCGNATPFHLAFACLPQGLFEKLGLWLIPALDVIAAPNILYKP
jgi:IS30 family transposase